MTDRRVVLRALFCIGVGLVAYGCFLLFSDVGGQTEIDLAGQKFSSSSVGLSVIVIGLAAVSVTVWFLKPGPEVAEVAAPATPVDDPISWDQLMEGVERLVRQLTAANGFRPDMVVGVCGGGLMVADLVAKRLGHIPCLSLWPNRHGRPAEGIYGGAALAVNVWPYDELFTSRSVERVLLVDDVAYSGVTLRGGLDLLRRGSVAVSSGEVEVRTAVVFKSTLSAFRPDYVVFEETDRLRPMPYSDRSRR